MKSFTLTLAVVLALALVAKVRASNEESSSSSSSEERILYRVRRDASDSSDSSDESSSSSDESVRRRKRSTSESSEESSESSSASSSDSSSDSSSEEAAVRRPRSASDSDSDLDSASSEEQPKRRGNNRRNRNNRNNRRNKREALLGLFDVDGEGHDSDHHYTNDELLNLQANLNLNTDQIAHLIRIASPIRRNKRATCDLLSYFNLGDTPCAAHCILKGFKGGWCDTKKICNCRH